MLNGNRDGKDRIERDEPHKLKQALKEIFEDSYRTGRPNSIIIFRENCRCYTRLKNFIQVNYYYDTNKYKLNRNDITLRVRQKEDSLRIQLKCLLKREGGLFVKNEFSENIDELPVKINKEKIQWPELLICEDDITLKGNLITERTVYKFNEAMEIDLNKNFYLGIIDYELELEFEFNSDFEADASNFVNDVIKNECSINFALGKSSRFYQKLKQMNKIK